MYVGMFYTSSGKKKKCESETFRVIYATAQENRIIVFEH